MNKKGETEIVTINEVDLDQCFSSVIFSLVFWIRILSVILSVIFLFDFPGWQSGSQSPQVSIFPEASSFVGHQAISNFSPVLDRVQLLIHFLEV